MSLFFLKWILCIRLGGQIQFYHTLIPVKSKWFTHRTSISFWCMCSQFRILYIWIWHILYSLSSPNIFILHVVCIYIYVYSYLFYKIINKKCLKFQSTSPLASVWEFISGLRDKSDVTFMCVHSVSFNLFRWLLSW